MADNKDQKKQNEKATDSPVLPYAVDETGKPKSKIVQAVEEQHRMLTASITDVVRQGNEAVVEAEHFVTDVAKRTGTAVKQIGDEAREVTVAVTKVIQDVNHLMSDDGVVGQSINQVKAMATTAYDTACETFPDVTPEQKRQLQTFTVGLGATVVAVGAIAMIVHMFRRH